MPVHRQPCATITEHVELEMVTRNAFPRVVDFVVYVLGTWEAEGRLPEQADPITAAKGLEEWNSAELEFAR